MVRTDPKLFTLDLDLLLAVISYVTFHCDKLYPCAIKGVLLGYAFDKMG